MFDYFFAHIFRSVRSRSRSREIVWISAKRCLEQSWSINRVKRKFIVYLPLHRDREFSRARKHLHEKNALSFHNADTFADILMVSYFTFLGKNMDTSLQSIETLTGLLIATTYMCTKLTLNCSHRLFEDSKLWDYKLWKKNSLLIVIRQSSDLHSILQTKCFPQQCKIAVILLQYCTNIATTFVLLRL